MPLASEPLGHLSGTKADTEGMEAVLGFAAGGTLGVLAVLVGSGCTWLNNRKELKLRELDVREQEAKARLAEAQVHKAASAISPATP